MYPWRRRSAGVKDWKEWRERREWSARDRARSFANAGRGVRILVAGQHNAWIHLALTAAALALGFALGISSLEWCAIALAIGLVWAAEGLNTAIELLADAAVPHEHPGVGRAKDVAAGAVLLAALAAAAVGVVVFLPRLVALVS
jgi:diacylglycerol kinase (ATP)